MQDYGTAVQILTGTLRRAEVGPCIHMDQCTLDDLLHARTLWVVVLKKVMWSACVIINDVLALWGFGFCWLGS